jgi:hypothetical protein
MALVVGKLEKEGLNDAFQVHLSPPDKLGLDLFQLHSSSPETPSPSSKPRCCQCYSTQRKSEPRTCIDEMC